MQVEFWLSRLSTRPLSARLSFLIVFECQASRSPILSFHAFLPSKAPKSVVTLSDTFSTVHKTQ